MTNELVPTDLPPVSELLRLGTELHKTGLLPGHIRSGGQAMAIILAGRELGLAPMTALRSIHLVEGRVTLAADLQLALVKRSGVKHRWLRTDAEAASVELTRPGDAPFAFTYSLEDARRAGLADKQNWKRHTPAMLRARAISAAIRAYCPDMLTSVYDPDELREGTGEGAAEPARVEGMPRVEEVPQPPQRVEPERTEPARTEPARSEPEDHLSWRESGIAWVHRLRHEAGIELGALEEYCRAHGRTLPRHGADVYRSEILDKLKPDTKGRAHFDAWLAKAKAEKVGGVA